MSIVFDILDMIDDRQTLTYAFFASAFLAPVAAVVAGYIA